MAAETAGRPRASSAATAFALGIRKLLGDADRADAPSPDVTPTTPVGPTESDRREDRPHVPGEEPAELTTG